MAATNIEVAVIGDGDPWAKFASAKPAQPSPHLAAANAEPKPSTIPTAGATVQVQDLTFHYPDIGTMIGRWCAGCHAAGTV